ncbi:hypothetical protein [Paenibacillus kribbensis]|uniref:hypothetical protein n=1 Tax=Paenibacillus kribbensis TaxID=172713 RepID=UPI0015B8A053|nr:hypothetical protein [Paenibacillus kribbensis]
MSISHVINDRTIARLSADLEKSVSSQSVITDKAYRFQKALEESWDAIVDGLSVADMEKRDMLLEPWASLANQRDRIVKALGE